MVSKALKIFRNPEEYLYLAVLERWERTAPSDGHDGVFDGKPASNTQTARIVKVLRMLTGLHDLELKKLQRHTERRDGRSNISKDAHWMRQRYELGKGWYFEGNMSLADKKKILDALPKLGLSSPEFVVCAQDFVEGKSLGKYWPSEEEAGHQIEQWKKAGYPFRRSVSDSTFLIFAPRSRLRE